MQISQRAYRNRVVATSQANANDQLMKASSNEEEPERKLTDYINVQETSSSRQGNMTNLTIMLQQQPLLGNAADQYASLKPILRNSELLVSPKQHVSTPLGSATQLAKATFSKQSTGRIGRTKSATKNRQSKSGSRAKKLLLNLSSQHYLIKQQYSSMQGPQTVRCSAQRPWTGKLHPSDFTNDLKTVETGGFQIQRTRIASASGNRKLKFQPNTIVQQDTLSNEPMPHSAQQSSAAINFHGTTSQALTAVSNATMMHMSPGIGDSSTIGKADKAGDQQMSLKHITPELAAQVVKHFVLPMFDTDFKKGLRRKYGRLQAGMIGSMGASQRAVTGQIELQQRSTDTVGALPGTVLGDLKLTEHLANELEAVRNKFESMHEALEKAMLARDTYKKKFISLVSKGLDMKKGIVSLRAQLEHQLKHNMGLELLLERKNCESEQLISTQIVSEQMRKQFCDKLRGQQVKNEALGNRLFNLNQEQLLSHHSIQFMQEQFTILHNAVNNISTQKKLGDKLNREIQLLTATSEQQSAQNEDLRENMSRIQVERDSFRSDTAELHKNKKIVEKNAAIDKATAKDREVRLQKQLVSLNNDSNAHMEELLTLQKTCKQLAMDKEKSKLRIQKLIQRKGKFESGQTCKKCSREYNEKENFKWSCRTHYGDYSGEMWWCCGKFGKDQLGCKYSSHETKDEDADDDDDANQINEQKNIKYKRCICCKEIGHSIEDCSRDPNIKTLAKADDEYLRISRMKDFRKLFADSIVQTTHLLKKSVMIPIKYDDDGNQEEEKFDAYNPFMRGVMEFDDYNYTVHNPYVLVEDPKFATQDATSKMKAKKPGPIKTTNQSGEVDLTFSQKNLNSSVTDDYEHPLTTIEPSEMEIEKLCLARKAQLAEEEAAKQKALNKDKKKNEKGSKLSSTNESEKDPDKTVAAVVTEGEGDATSRKSAQDEVDDVDSDDAEYQYRVFYKKDEIHMTKTKQEKDQFEWLMKTRKRATRELLQKLGPSQQINILDHLPNNLRTVQSPKSKKGMKQSTGRLAGINSMKMGTLDNLSDDSEKEEDYQTIMEKQRRKAMENEGMDEKMHGLEMTAIEKEIKALLVTKNDKESQDSIASTNKKHARKTVEKRKSKKIKE